jgi:hypothetical protein
LLAHAVLHQQPETRDQGGQVLQVIPNDWSLDMTFREDESRIRERTLTNNIAWLRRFALTLIKQHPGKDSMVMKRRMAGWNVEFLMQLLTGKGA